MEVDIASITANLLETIIADQPILGSTLAKQLQPAILKRKVNIWSWGMAAKCRLRLLGNIVNSTKKPKSTRIILREMLDLAFMLKITV